MKTDVTPENLTQPSLEAVLKEHGIDITPDFSVGKQRNGAQWLFCREIEVDGKKVQFGYFGDFSTGLTTEWHGSQLELTDEQKKSFNKFRSEQKKTRLEMRDAAWEEARIESVTFFETCTSQGKTPYMERKKIDSLHNARIFSKEDQNNLAIPLYDNDDKVWNVQRIYNYKGDSGDRFFWKNARVEGLSHRFGPKPSEGEMIFICEGWATGAAIFEALDMKATVYCAMTAGNLKAVAEGLAEKFSKSHFVFCADDDRFKRPNTGINKAREAAASIKAKVASVKVTFPKFASDVKEPTDFNDLLVHEGRPMVQDQLVHPEKYASTANQHVTPLGFSDENYYFTSSSNLQINRLRELSETDLYKLMPREFWIDKYGELITKGQKKGAVAVDWAVVKSDLMNQCRTLGRFELTMVRGHGVWLDGGETVIHLGDRLSRNDEIIGLRDIKNSSHIYEFSRKLEPIHSEPLTDSEMTLFLDIVALLNYARPEQQMFFAGWLAVANVCGILSWRPHIWITGEQGSGKSTTIQYIVRPLTSALTKFYFKGATTEAGIRQAMGSSCAPVLFDEFESASHRAAGRIEQIIELFRQASSDDDGVTAKGTSSGEAMEYNPRFCSAVASIGTSLITNQDKARFTLIELMKIKGDASQLAKLQSLLVDLTPEYCARFLARMIQLVPVIQHNQRLLQKACARRHTHRFGQQYGTLLAGWCAVQHSRKISEAEADELAAKVKLEQEISSNQIPDHEECLQHLLQKQIRVDDLTTSIASILANDAKEPNWDALANQAWKDDPYWKMVKPRLASLGIIPSVIEKKQGFVVLSTHPELNSLFRETRWSRNWAQALARLPGAVPNKRVRDIGSDRVTGTWVPAELLQGLDKPTPPF